MEECPICCNHLDNADKSYCLRCPTDACDFNMCSRCIASLQKSSADGYQVASDGSKQVKVQMQCPQCRRKYECTKYPSSVLIPAILLLRKASRLEESIGDVDSNLTARVLSDKYDFKQTCSIEQLEDSVRRVSEYLKEIGKQHNFPTLDVNIWAGTLPPTSAMGGSSPKNRFQHVDPTLLCGLDEFMSRDEQEFVCERLTSGTTEGLVQGAQILQSMLELTALGKATVQSDPNPDIHKLRMKHKLPARMPRYVHLPHFDPEDTGKQLKFQGKNTLILSSVRGGAGSLGLRKNDQVTHFQGEKIGNYEMFNAHMKAAFHEFPEGTSPIVVNADMETAFVLQKRAAEVAESFKTTTSKMMKA